MTLNSTRCIGRFLVRFEFVIDFDYTEFLEDYKLEELVAAVADLLGKDEDEIVIQELREGSAEVTGSVSATDDADADSSSATLS